MSKAFLVILLMFCFVVATPQRLAQESSSLSDGILLYEQGDTQGAIKALREASKKSKKDPKPWHYLGLAFFRQDNRKAAYEAFDKAIGLRERLIKMELDREEDAWRDDQLNDFKALLHDQIEGQSKLLEIVTEPGPREVGELVLARSRVLADCVDKNIRRVNGHVEVTKTDLKLEKMRVLSKPPPRYPESGRGDRVNGNVILKVIFAADASIKHIELLQSPDSRLTEESIKAARLIRFTPESICGNPVNSRVQVEYNFYIGSL